MTQIYLPTDEIVEDLKEHLDAALDELRRRDAMQQDGSKKIKGIKPFDLYRVKFVAERWDVCAHYVRNLPAEDLPRADWQGGEIRYRGIDILRFEGVDLELPENVKPLRSETKSPESKPKGSGSSSDRPYNNALPEI